MAEKLNPDDIVQLKSGVPKMHKLKHILWLSLIFTTQAWSASIVYTYNSKGETNGIVGIAGIAQESSWRCKSDSSLLCQCPTALFSGVIAQVDYRRGENVAEGFVLETNQGSEYIGLGQAWDSDLGTADSSWIPKLLRKGERVFVVAEMCGAGGRNIVGRDVYSHRMLPPTLLKSPR
ncbi:MAG TPA: hypothetical protein PKN13_10070 [Accumulibacter sp.]|nr:hypothetical protein [Accumulibacter sp.]HMW18265.1 hypothetical protein [Accumulibacter sp.]HMY07433.1 hypothetical protein [Accumulibacter sp.]HNC17178.1 hypothetical protein [Accumulibacter sp.]HND81217.1 hypothetical protein [Accumulibacter sp.]